jgi:hypothetical protein
MRLEYLPTLSEMREMLGEDLYVKFVWMWREQEQDARAIERRQKVLGALAAKRAETLPSPMFERLERTPEPSAARAFQAALLRPNVPRLQDGVAVSELDGLLDQIRVDATASEQDDPPREAVAASSGRRRHR